MTRESDCCCSSVPVWFARSIPQSLPLILGRDIAVFSQDGAAWFLVISAFIGITVGDNCWLIALKAIGARRVILVDAIKPFAAALLAWPIFGEEIS